MDDRKEYRVTWRHEVHFMADNDQEAKDIWEELHLGELELETCANEGVLHQHGYIERVSFECIDDDYREVK